MANAPQIELRDGSGYAVNTAFTTNIEYLVLRGTVDVTTVDLQVSINGGPFVSDPTLVALDLTDWTFPNLTSYPDGFLMDPGVNTIVLRAIDLTGGVSATATALVTLVQSLDDSSRFIPTSIRARRRRDAVDILVAQPLDNWPGPTTAFGAVTTDIFRGFNIYASSTPGGTAGYFKVNELPAQEIVDYEEDTFPIGDDTTTWDVAAPNARVQVTDVDEFGNELETRLDQLYDTSVYNEKIRFAGSIEAVNLTPHIRFRHIRTGAPGMLNTDQWVGLDDDDPLYYVAAGLFFDPISGTEWETPYSQEVLGSPFVIDTSITNLPTRQQIQVVVDYVLAIQRVNSEIALIPGSTTRDVSIDPFASEIERIWFLVDFVHRSYSFLTLLQIDDINNDGFSDAVATNAYKTALKAALGFTTDEAVQTLIDTQFDKLAANASRTRLPGRPAVGQLVLYTTTRPAQDIPVPSGTIATTSSDEVDEIPSVRFIVGGTYTMRSADADAYYNFDTKRYEIIVDIYAESLGDDGNRPAGQITQITGIAGLQCTNTEATVFGTDRESNADLAARVILGYVSVDTGTEGGYQTVAAAQIGAVKSKVIKSGDPLMMRDWDDIRKKHVGGKVDIWVQGLRERQVTNTFAFTFGIARDVRCAIIDLGDLRFRVLDSRVTPDTPLMEILDNLPQGLGVRNVTLGQDYDLTSVVIEDYNTFKINTAIPQPITMIDDIIQADYRFRSVNEFVLPLQPVRRVVSVSGQISGTLVPTTGYTLYKTEDPLWEGESTIAGNYLTINQVGGVPSGDTTQVSDEQHVMIGFVEEPLLNIGINTATIRVFNLDRTIEFDGPEQVVPDYEVIAGTPTTPVRIQRTSGSDIKTGETVSVDYTHDENFTVTYVINDILQQLQRTISGIDGVGGMRHITADVLVKQTISNSIELETTIQLNKGATKDKTDPLVRTNVSQDLNQRLIGDGVAQSDVIKDIDSTDGVDFNVVPFARMAYEDGSLKLREGISSANVHVSSLDYGAQRAFILSSPLQSPTTDGGALDTEHRGVFQDDVAMSLSGTLALVGDTANQTFIIGAGGAIIQGYSDDATLLAEGFTTADARETERLRRTANHVVVALEASGVPLDEPNNHEYAVSYVVRGDFGSHNIEASEVEFLDLGDFTITYRTA